MRSWSREVVASEIEKLRRIIFWPKEDEVEMPGEDRNPP